MTTEDRKFPEPQPFTDKARPPIALQPVESSQVSGVGYDEASKTLAVQFKFGARAIYHYTGVEPQTYADFMAAKSKGVFFKEHIKPLAFEKFPAEPEPEDGPQSDVAAAAGGLTQTPVEV